MKTIRELQHSDKEIYLELMKEFFSSEAVLHSIPEAYMERTFEISISDNPLSDCFIFEYDHEPVGYGLLSLSYSNESGGLVVWIEEVYIREAYRSKGFGKEFFAFTEKHYGKDLARIRLEVEDENTRAIELYEKLGYKRIKYTQMYKDI